MISGCTQDNNKYCGDNFPGTYYDPSTKMCEKTGTQTLAQQTSIVGKKTDLNIGDSVVLSSKDYSVSVRVVNLTQEDISYDYGSEGIRKGKSYKFQIEIKNVGKKAIQGALVRYWITDWAGVIHESGQNTYGRTNYVFIDTPLYPGDTSRVFESHDFWYREFEGKLTFYYHFGDDTASWIIKSE